MKVHIIYLDPHDDRSSVRDKLSWGQAPHIVLVWPKSGQVLTEPLDLAVLQRHARRRGSQIGLVTHDPDVRFHAERLEIPCFLSLSELPDEAWPLAATLSPLENPLRTELVRRAESLRQALASNPSQRRAQSLLARWLLFMLGLISVASLAAVLVPSAELVVQPERESIQGRLRVTLDPESITTAGLGVVPVRRVSARMLGELGRKTSGEVPVPVSYAGGTAIFTNLTPDEVLIPAGTGLRSSADPLARFETVEALRLPASVGSTGEVQIKATIPGPFGNLPSGSIDAIDGLLGLQARVAVPDGTSGGRDEIRSGVSQSDLDLVAEDLEAQLLDRAATSLQSSLSPLEGLLPDSVAVSQVFTRQYSHAVGDPTETLTLTMDLEISALVYQQADLDQAILALLARSFPPGHTWVPDSLQVEFLSPPSPGPGKRFTVDVRARCESYRSADLGRLRVGLRGAAPEQAAQRLSGEPNLQIISLRLSPRWLPILPILPSRIHLSWPWPSR